MPVSGKDHQEMAALKETGEGGASVGENGNTGLGNGLDGGTS